ncbi:unnamed protein product [Rotaria sordida]|uniref:Uncharacterized protein n=2 Tax=Rotaria sordida TaxID=392033 RepID=A0A819V5T1_9BILA|nr:unnamed protein product [Rotaria sordida]
MESVCMELQQRPHLLQLWDELAIFLGLFGGSRSERASYDRGIMCELYNPTGIVRRQLVSRTNVMVKPRLCILAAGHPRETINCLTGSGVKAVESNDDGLFNRFLIAVGLKRKPSRDCTPPDNRIPKLAHLFYYVHQLHKEPQEYSFNQEAYTYMKDTTYAYDCESVSFSNEDDYLASNLTKAIEHVQRLASILHILKTVSRKIFNLTNQFEVYGPLDENLKNLILSDSLTNEELIIDYESCFNAKKMMDYYLSIKKILAGYDPINNKSLTGKEGNNIEGIPQSDIEHIKSYIKNHPSKRILLSVLPSNLKRKYTKDQYLPILRQMETDGEGTITTTENTTRPKAIVFIKKPRTEQASASSNNTTNDES